MIRGTRVLQGEDAHELRKLEDNLRHLLPSLGYQEIIIPTLWELQTFIGQFGPAVNKLYAFKDKKGRDICLIPEVTAIIQELHKEGKLEHNKIFYVNRCYRYERPQKGRYREFTQFGVENLTKEVTIDEMIETLEVCLSCCNIKYEIDSSVKRGLHYYVGDGFEANNNSGCLGESQKQIAGGGRYSGGIGFAIGLERLLLCRARAKPGQTE